MKKRQLLIFWGVVLFLSIMVFCPLNAKAEETVVIPGIVEVEENHLYMVPIGTDDGVKKGNTVEIVRDEKRIADARLISVLSDNSMVEIVVLFIKTDIMESDSIRFRKEGEGRKKEARKTLGVGRTTVEEIIVTTKEDEKRKGLLGSEMHRYEEVAAVEGPLQKEIKQLKAGLALVRDEYEGKVDTILSSVGGEKDALAVEKKWKEKLVSTEKRYRAQYRERKKLLEKDTARLGAKVAALSNELEIVNQGTDKRIQQLLSDLRDKEDQISEIKQAFVEEHLAGEKQWKAKLENMEARYQSQLRVQKENFESQFKTEQEKSQHEISYLNEQINLVKESSGDKNNTLQVRLKDSEDQIDELRKEQYSLESDLNREKEQVRKRESDVVTLKDVIAATKRVHTKELAISRKPLESKIEDMSVEFISIKHDYERELNALRKSSQEDLLKNESQWVDKFASIEQKYQNEMAQINAKNAAQVNQLRAELGGQKNVIELLKQNQSELTVKLKASEQQFTQSQNDASALESQLSVEKATRLEKINTAKKPLEDKVAEMSSQMASLRQGYENQFEELQKENTAKSNKFQEKKSEDASLIEFLNGAMADLTADLEDRDQTIANLETSYKLSQGEIAAMKKSHLERIELAKKPLADQIEVLNKDIAQLIKSHEAEVKGIQESASRELLTSEENWQAQFRAQEKKSQKNIEVQQKQMAGQIKDLQKTIGALQNEHEKELLIAQSNTDKEISTLQAQWQVKLSEVELDYQKKLNEETGKKQGVVDFLKEEKSGLIAQMASLQREHDAKIKEIEVMAQKGQVAVNDELQLQLANAQKDHEIEKAGFLKTISSLTDQFDFLKDDSSSVIETLQGELKKKRDEISTLTKSNSDVVSKMTQQEAQLKKSEDGFAALTDQVKSSEGKVTKLTDQLKFIKGNSDSAIGELQAQLEERRQVVRTLEDKASDLTSTMESRVSDLTSALETRERRNAELKNNVAELKDELKSARVSYADQVKIAKHPLEERIKTLESELKSLWGDAKKELKVAESDWQEKMAKKGSEWKKKLASKDEGHKKEVKSLKKELETLWAEAKKDLALAEKEWKVKFKEKDKELAQIRKKPEAEWKVKFAENDKQWSDKLALAEENYQNGLKSQEENLQSQIAGLNHQLNELKTDGNGVIDQLRADHKVKQEMVRKLEKENPAP